MSPDLKRIYLNILKREVPITEINKIGNYYRILWAEVDFGESYCSYLGPGDMNYLTTLMINKLLRDRALSNQKGA